MDHDTDTHFCVGCGCEISISVYVVSGRLYCCEDCYHHLPCRCSERMELEDEQSSKQQPLAISY